MPSVSLFLLPANSCSYLQCCLISGRELKCFQVAFSSLHPPRHLWEHRDRDWREHFLTPGSMKLFALQERDLPCIDACSWFACHDGTFFLSVAEKSLSDFWKQNWEFGSSEWLYRRCQGLVEWFMALGNYSHNLSPGCFLHPHAGLWCAKTLILSTGTEPTEGEALDWTCCKPCVDVSC